MFLIIDKSEADFTILINPDDVPELDEEITVTLTYVSPSDTQRLKYGSTQVKVVILENDNPGGTFQFSTNMQDLYQVQVCAAFIFKIFRISLLFLKKNIVIIEI